MSFTPNFEFNEYTNIFLKFIMDLFVDSSDDISEMLVLKSEKVAFKSEWEGSGVISNLVDKWNTSDLPSTFTFKDNKFIKLHFSEFNLIYRSIKGHKTLIGTKFQMKKEEISVFSIIKQTGTMQTMQLTAMKDIIISIIELGQKMSDFIVKDSHNLQIGIKFPENKLIIKKFIESLKILQFVCEYTDRGDALNLKFKYEKKEKKIYPDYMYK